MRKKKTSSHRIQGQNLDVYDGIEAALSPPEISVGIGQTFATLSVHH